MFALGAILIFLSLCIGVKSVPTHHLTIGVQGNTPTLIVASSEIIDKISLQQQQQQQHEKLFKKNNGGDNDSYTENTDKIQVKGKMMRAQHSPVNERILQRQFFDNATLNVKNVTTIATTTATTIIDFNTNGTNHMKAAQLFTNDTLKLVSNKHKDKKDKIIALSSNETPPILNDIITKYKAGNQHHQQQQHNNHQNYTQLKTLIVQLLPTTVINNKIASFENSFNITTTAATTTNGQQQHDQQHNSKVIKADRTEMAPKATQLHMKPQSKTKPINKSVADKASTTKLDNHKEQHLSGNLKQPNIGQSKATPLLHPTLSNIKNFTTHLIKPTNWSTAAAAMKNSNIPVPTNLTLNLSTEIMPTQQPTTDRTFLVKLLDLEGVKGNFSIMDQTNEYLHYKGHDGLKITKKKQLQNKHYLDSLSRVDNLMGGHSPNDSSASLLPHKVLHKPTIKFNSLGPIVMGERVFHNQHTTTTEPTTSADVEATAAITTIKASHEPKKQSRMIFGLKAKPLQSSKSVMSVKNLNMSVLSTTIFEVTKPKSTNITPLPQQQQSLRPSETMFTTKEKLNESVTETPLKEKTESKISDIQIEVYDSTMDTTIENSNSNSNYTDNSPMKDRFHHHTIVMEPFRPIDRVSSTMKPSMGGTQQERFTQYVIDRNEASTPHTIINLTSIHVESGKPEPAAIEIHINVSESFAGLNSNANIDNNDFSQSENYKVNARIGSETFYESQNNNNIKFKSPSNLAAIAAERKIHNHHHQNKTIKVRNGEVLLIEIINTDDATNANNSGNLNRMILSDNDELFMADMDIKVTATTSSPKSTNQSITALLEQSLPLPTIDRNSDTIFYISNTEVKVGEPLPTTKTINEQQQQQQQQHQRNTNFRNQFFPIEYMTSTAQTSNINDDDDNVVVVVDGNANVGALPSYHIYEEDIILSPNSHNQANTLKIYRNRANVKNTMPLGVTYLGESIIDIEEDNADNDEMKSTQSTSQSSQPSQSSQMTDIIIEPANLSEISIGVPVIGELPPQVDLKAIDIMPNQLNELQSSIKSKTPPNIIENISNNTGRPTETESSIQYGGDLIADNADNGFDGIEGSYPFANPKDLLKKRTHTSDYIHYTVDNGISNLRKNVLSADIKEPIEEENDNNELLGNKDDVDAIQNDDKNNTYLHLNYTIIEKLEKNVSLLSIIEESSKLLDTTDRDEDIVNLLSLIIGVFIIILPLIVSISLFCVLRYVYHKYQFNMQNMSNGKSNKECSDDDKYINENKNPTDQSIPPPLPPISSSSTSTSISPTPTLLSLNKIIKQDIKEKQAQDATTISSTHNKPPFIVTFNQEHHHKHENHHHQNQYQAKHQLNDPHQDINNMKQYDDDVVADIKNSITNSECQLSVTLLPTVIGNPMKKFQKDINHKTNGSITKMTLENNILIVETEERNDISRIARETKMDYHKDGIFVVEVARGIDSKTLPASPITNNDERVMHLNHCKPNGNIGYKIINEKHFLNDENVQIHSAPFESDEYNKNLQQIEEIEEPLDLSPTMKTMSDDISINHKQICTGLSQSDLSSTSSDNINKDYTCGKQQIYEFDPNTDPKIPSIHNNNTDVNLNMKNELLATDDATNNNLPETASPKLDQIMLNGPIKSEITNPCQKEMSDDIPDILCNTLTADSCNGNFIDLPPPPPSPSTINENLTNNLSTYNMYCTNASEISLPPPPPPQLNDHTDLHITSNGDMLASPLTPPASPPPPPSPPPLHCFNGSDGMEVQLTSTVNVTSS